MHQLYVKCGMFRADDTFNRPAKSRARPQVRVNIAALHFPPRVGAVADNNVLLRSADSLNTRLVVQQEPRILTRRHVAKRSTVPQFAVEAEGTTRLPSMPRVTDSPVAPKQYDKTASGDDHVFMGIPGQVGFGPGK